MFILLAGSIKIPKEEILHEKLNEAKRQEITKNDNVKNNDDNEEDDDDDDVIVGPLPPPDISDNKQPDEVKINSLPVSAVDSDDNFDDDSDSEIELSPIQKAPKSHEITLQHGSKVVSTLALDPSGSRLATGSYDYDVKFWDFNSMDVNLRAFRTLTPIENHWIKSLQYSLTGDMVLIAAGNAQPQVLDRDGHQVYECKKGDQYIVDMKNTKGHVSMVNAASWDPKCRDNFISCADDGTIRIWDINTVKKNKDVIRLKNKQARKTVCTYCCFNRDGKLILGSGQDGSIQAWDTRKMFVNTAFKNMQTHSNGTDTSCLCLSYDDRTLISRGGDDTVKQWDLRSFRQPVAVAQNLISYYNVTDCIFSPDEKLILTGTSVKKDQGNGRLVFLERDTLQVADELEFENNCVVSILWHQKINQIMVGLSNGHVKVLFDPSKSNNGATLCVGKVKHNRIDPGEGLLKPQIINPHSLRMFREKRAETMKKVKAKQRADPVLSHKPEIPLEGHGVGGRMKQGMSLTGFVVKNIALAKADHLNPREAVLRHAKAAEESPFWVAPAYSATQPKPIFQKAGSDSGR